MPKRVEGERAERVKTCLVAHGDAVARQNAEDEERMAARIAANRSKFVALSIEEEGVE
jgi:hypothetical protein